MTATEIQALEAAREDAINKIITTRLSNAYDCEKLAFNNVDVTLTKDGVDVTREYSLILELFKDKNTIYVSFYPIKKKAFYCSFWITSIDAQSILEGKEYKEFEGDYCLTIKAI